MDINPIPVLKDIPKRHIKSMSYHADKQELKQKTNLWHTTCFETFLFAKKDPSYIELHSTLEGCWIISLLLNTAPQP